MEVKKVGYDYVHSLVEAHSRLAFSEILPDEKGTTCAAFLRRAAAYFADKGTSRIERIMTDNTFTYRHSADMKKAGGDLTTKDCRGASVETLRRLRRSSAIELGAPSLWRSSGQFEAVELRPPLVDGS